MVDAPALSLFSSRDHRNPWVLGNRIFSPLLVMCGLGIWLHSTRQWIVLMVCAAFSASPYHSGNQALLCRRASFVLGETALSHSTALTLVTQKSSALSSFPSLILPSAKTSVSLYLIPLQFTCQADQWRDSWADRGHLCVSY